MLETVSSRQIIRLILFEGVRVKIALIGARDGEFLQLAAPLISII